MIDGQVLILGMPLRLSIEQLDALYRARAFQQMGLLFRAAHDVFFFTFYVGKVGRLLAEEVRGFDALQVAGRDIVTTFGTL